MELARERTLSPRDLAAALGVSESSVKRWIDAGRIVAARTAGGHRRIVLTDALRFVRASGLRVREAAALGLPGLEDDAEVEAGSLREALLAGDGPRVRALLQRAFAEGEDLAALADGPLRGACSALGAAWHDDFVAGVADEHRAMVLLLEALAVVGTLAEPPADGAPVAVGGAPSGDPYAVPSALAALVLAGEGWRAENLGPDVPPGVLVDFARRRGARLAWLSCSVPLDEAAAAEVGRAAAALAEGGATLVVGGRHAGPLAAHAGIRHGASMADLREIARDLAA